MLWLDQPSTFTGEVSGLGGAVYVHDAHGSGLAAPVCAVALPARL